MKQMKQESARLYRTFLLIKMRGSLRADRGFADQKFFRFLDEELVFKYVIRIKSSTTIIHQRIKNKALKCLREDGKIVQLKALTSL